jgi:hypothetical protein
VAKSDKTDFSPRRLAAAWPVSSFEGRSGRGEGIRFDLGHEASPDRALMQRLVHPHTGKIGRRPAGTIKLAFRKLNSILCAELTGAKPDSNNQFNGAAIFAAYFPGKQTGRSPVDPRYVLNGN